MYKTTNLTTIAFWRSAAVLVCLAVLAWGCGDTPGVETIPADAPLHTVGWGTQISFSDGPVGEAGAEGDENDQGEDENKKEEVLVGELGGNVTFDRLCLDFPPGALVGRNTIGIHKINSGQSIWEFTVNGAHKTVFAKPVTLKVDYSDQNETDVFAIFWFDKDSSEWVNMGGNNDPETRTLTLKLDHFSLYAFVRISNVDPDGSAGWE